MKYLVIGDVHAEYIPFKRAINFARSNDLHLVSVGDIVDGGPDGAICVNEMLKLLDEKKASIVKGNHEHKIIRKLNGANVILGPPNIITIEQMETDKRYQATMDAPDSLLQQVSILFTTCTHTHTHTDIDIYHFIYL